ncbi:MAG TPA: hypothetical protein VG844_14620 [Terracidiphilus sp.]|nr:hypothetical protein [Terracidiphilus sp.]
MAQEELIIECEDISGGLQPLFTTGDLQLDIPGIHEPLNVFVVQNMWNSEGHSSLRLQPLQSPCWFSTCHTLHSGRFVVINFAHYWMGQPRNLSFTLRSLGWEAHFIPVTGDTIELPPLFNSDEEFRATHQVEFSREDGSSFTGKQAQAFLEKLSLFLSFCRGRWVTFALTVGLDDNAEKALEQWGTGRISSWKRPMGWLDEHHGSCISELYAKFYSKLDDVAWLDAVRHVVYWFARADTNLVGPDGACILLQAALERLAWHVLVRERGAISDKGFRDLTAADQIRLMLNVFSIPTEIPDGLVSLRKLGKSSGLEGPEAFTYIRNRLTHPPKRGATSEVLPIYEAYCLAQWYVELAILSACGYNGEYGNRTIIRRWVGQVEKVPWASKSPEC